MFILKLLWHSIKYTCHTHLGLILATAATLLWAICVGTLYLNSGIGGWADFLFVSASAIIGIPLLTFAIAALLALLRLLPRLLAGFLLASGCFISLLWFGAPAYLGITLAAAVLLIECTLGATVTAIMRGTLRSQSRLKRAIIIAALILSVAANVALFRLLQTDGVNEDLLQSKPYQLPLPLALPDPSKPGPYAVKTLYYGSGDSLRRPEFGPSVAIRTNKVDASAFFKDFDGWRAWIRKWYWGFGMNQLPLNGRVFYPDAPGPFPLFLIVHGNHRMNAPSDNGYAYLCELLASRGFVAVSIDENFLNIGLFHEPPNQQAVRAWLLLEHLRLWHAWTRNPSSPLFGKADLSRIALAGHSRGGEAAATAALFNKLAYDPNDATIRFDYHYAIRSVIAIAGVDGQYKPAGQPRVLTDVNYLTLHGSNDSDVSSFEGSRQYERVHFTGGVPAFKSELYVYRANHSQFNTVWGRTDIDTPAGWLLNLRPLLSANDQRQVAKVYISAFLEATLHDVHGYQDLFRDYRRGRQWLPKTLYLNSYQDQNYQTLCNFSEDADVTTTTAPGGHISASGMAVWYEGNIPWRHGSQDYNGVFLGWDWQKQKAAPADPPTYSIDLPSSAERPILSLSVAATDDDPPGDELEDRDVNTSFSIEGLSANGAAARVSSNAFMPLLPPLHVRLTKFERLDEQLFGTSSEPVFQTIEIPFRALAQLTPSFDPAQVRRIRLVFDRTPARVIIIRNIGLEGSSNAFLSK